MKSKSLERVQGVCIVFFIFFVYFSLFIGSLFEFPNRNPSAFV